MKKHFFGVVAGICAIVIVVILCVSCTVETGVAKAEPTEQPSLPKHTQIYGDSAYIYCSNRDDMAKLLEQFEAASGRKVTHWFYMRPEGLADNYIMAELEDKSGN